MYVAVITDYNLMASMNLATANEITFIVTLLHTTQISLSPSYTYIPKTCTSLSQNAQQLLQNKQYYLIICYTH